MADGNGSTGGQQGGEDYKALYEQSVAESRKWEQRAKDNKALLDARADYDEVIKSRDEANAALEAMTAERDSAAAERDSLTAQIAHRDLLDKVSAEKGVPANLLHGETEEELIKSADALAGWAAKMQPSYPADNGGGTTPKTITAKDIDKGKRDTTRDRMERLAERARLKEQELRG